MIEGRRFSLFTDHKPLTYAFRQRTDKCSPRQCRQLDYISQFTTDIQHIKGADNIAADALSRLDAISMPNAIDFQAIDIAQRTDEELKTLLSHPEGLEFQRLTMPDSGATVVCDMSTGTARPYILEPFRKRVFLALHNLAHPGTKASSKLLTARFVWPRIKRDATMWSRECLACQKAKVYRHTTSPIGSFTSTTGRFAHVHLDLVGPLPPSAGCSYCLTMIDRFTRWPEAVPLPDITAETVSKAFYETWVARFGAPARITTDQGRQFESKLFDCLTRLLGIQRIRSSPYHPQANGLIEQFHRPLKAAIKSHTNTQWTTALPTILLGFRAAFKEDLQATTAELVYGQPLRLPGEFFTPTAMGPDPKQFVEDLKAHFSLVRPSPTTCHGPRTVFVHPKLHECTHVFVRYDGVKTPLQFPYDGPFKVLTRRDKTFDVALPNRKATIAIDRLKLAFLAADHGTSMPTATDAATPINTGMTMPAPTAPVTTRYGRTSKKPIRFVSFTKDTAGGVCGDRRQMSPKQREPMRATETSPARSPLRDNGARPIGSTEMTPQSAQLARPIGRGDKVLPSQQGRRE